MAEAGSPASEPEAAVPADATPPDLVAAQLLGAAFELSPLALFDQPVAGIADEKERNPEMETLRSEYMRLRLNTFWWTFGMSIAGLVFSIVSILIAIFYGGRSFP